MKQTGVVDLPTAQPSTNGHKPDEQPAFDWMKATAIAIVGHRGSGKGSLACSLLERVKDRDVHVFMPPRPELIESRGWIVMRRLEQMYELQDAVVWLDECQLTIPTLDKRANDGLMKLLTIARHRNLTLLFSTCDTRWVTRGLEAMIDVWCITDVEPRLVKQGALIRKVIQRHVLADVDGFRLEPGEYLFYARSHPDLDGYHRFTMPSWYAEEGWSKGYALREKSDGSSTMGLPG